MYSNGTLPLTLTLALDARCVHSLKAYDGESKINSTKKTLCEVGFEPGTLGPLVAHLVLHSDAYLTELTWHCL